MKGLNLAIIAGFNIGGLFTIGYNSTYWIAWFKMSWGAQLINHIVEFLLKRLSQRNRRNSQKYFGRPQTESEWDSSGFYQINGTFASILHEIWIWQHCTLNGCCVCSHLTKKKKTCWKDVSSDCLYSISRIQTNVFVDLKWLIRIGSITTFQRPNNS